MTESMEIFKFKEWKENQNQEKQFVFNGINHSRVTRKADGRYFVDGQWVFFEYEPKKTTIGQIEEFDKDRIHVLLRTEDGDRTKKEINHVVPVGENFKWE